MPSVSASGVDRPSESTEMHWPPTVCRAQGNQVSITSEKREQPGVLRGGSRRFQPGRSKEALWRRMASGRGLEGWESSPPLPHWFCASWASESVPGGEEASVQMVPLPGSGHGWESPRCADFGYTGRRVNGQESGGLPLPAWEALGK